MGKYQDLRQNYCFVVAEKAYLSILREFTDIFFGVKRNE